MKTQQHGTFPGTDRVGLYADDITQAVGSTPLVRLRRMTAEHGELKHAADLDEDRMVVVILPDGGIKYISKIFNDDWMRRHGHID